MPQPTQVRRPWRATARSVFQLAVALATLLPFVASGVYDDLDAAPVVVGQVLAVAGVVTRVMALPQVEDFLRTFFPWLAAQPPGPGDEAGHAQALWLGVVAVSLLVVVALLVAVTPFDAVQP